MYPTKTICPRQKQFAPDKNNLYPSKLFWTYRRIRHDILEFFPASHCPIWSNFFFLIQWEICFDQLKKISKYSYLGIHYSKHWNFVIFRSDDEMQWKIISEKLLYLSRTLMPCPFTGPKMFCTGPNFLCQTKNSSIYCGSHKQFVPDKKMICIQ